MDHIGLAVTNLEASKNWYGDVLGIEMIDHISFISSGIEENHTFWEKGCRFFKLLTPTGEKVEFCQIL